MPTVEHRQDRRRELFARLLCRLNPMKDLGKALASKGSFLARLGIHGRGHERYSASRADVVVGAACRRWAQAWFKNAPPRRSIDSDQQPKPKQRA